MAAADHLQPQQLAMFMSEREITSSYSPPMYERQKVYPEGAPSRLETDDELFARKGAEAKKPDWDRLHSDIKKHGVQEPIDLTPSEIGEGHHRLGVMRNLNPDQLLPVRHHASLSDVGNYIMDNT